MFAHLNPHSSGLGDICALYSPFSHQVIMYVVRVSYGLVEASLGVGTVFILGFSVAITGGGGVLGWVPVPPVLSCTFLVAFCSMLPLKKVMHAWLRGFVVSTKVSSTQGATDSTTWKFSRVLCTASVADRVGGWLSNRSWSLGSPKIWVVGSRNTPPSPRPPSVDKHIPGQDHAGHLKSLHHGPFVRTTQGVVPVKLWDLVLFSKRGWGLRCCV